MWQQCFRPPVLRPPVMVLVFSFSVTKVGWHGPDCGRMAFLLHAWSSLPFEGRHCSLGPLLHGRYYLTPASEGCEWDVKVIACAHRRCMESNCSAICGFKNHPLTVSGLWFYVYKVHIKKTNWKTIFSHTFVPLFLCQICFTNYKLCLLSIHMLNSVWKISLPSDLNALSGTELLRRQSTL